MKYGIIALMLLSLIVLPSGAPFGMGSRAPAVGMPAADFTLPTLDGRTVSLAELRGKVVLLNFWATWCKPCTTEMPAMQATYDRLRDKGFVVLAINELEDVPKVREHIRTYQHTFPVLLDQDNAVANLYGVYGLPVSVFVDAEGRVQEYVKGGILTEQKIEDVIARLQGNPALRAEASTRAARN
jgi:peroxiredoxin